MLLTYRHGPKKKKILKKQPCPVNINVDKLAKFQNKWVTMFYFDQT